MANEHSVLSAAQVDELLLDSQRLRIEVKRLEGEKEILIIACGKAHSVGMEAAAAAVRTSCDNCDRDGHDVHGDECAYCGIPMKAIRAAAKEKA